jgi:hypothetical protein
VLSCVECRKQPQAVGDLCLGCNNSIGRSNEPRLRELHLRDPGADSRTFRTPATQLWPLTIPQLSPTSTVSGEVPNQSRLERSTRFASHATSPKLAKLIGAALTPAERRDTIQLTSRNSSSKLATLGGPRQIQTFHSTQCICDLGSNSLKFCTWQSCGICAIIRSAFTAFEFGAKSNSGRLVNPTPNLLT